MNEDALPTATPNTKDAEEYANNFAEEEARKQFEKRSRLWLDKLEDSNELEYPDEAEDLEWEAKVRNNNRFITGSGSSIVELLGGSIFHRVGLIKVSKLPSSGDRGEIIID